MTGGPLTEDDKRELCAWRYEGAYALYNLPPYEELRARFPGKPLVLAVRTWNLRAIRCYQKAGFRAEGGPYEAVTPCGRGEFIRMVWDGRP